MKGSYAEAPSATLYANAYSCLNRPSGNPRYYSPHDLSVVLQNLVGCIHSILAGEAMLHLLLTDFSAHSPYKQYCSVLVLSFKVAALCVSRSAC